MATWRHTKSGRTMTSSSHWGYPWVNLDEVVTYEFAARTADAIMADVGTDPDLARAALAAEKEREQPRTTLVAKLERVIRDAEVES